LKQVKVRQKSGKEVCPGVESTGNTRFFKKQPEAAGIKVTVINTLKFKVAGEPVKKTDGHDAATTPGFPAKDMLPESKPCPEKSLSDAPLASCQDIACPANCFGEEPDTRFAGGDRD
jgi:hypothetical protein